MERSAFAYRVLMALGFGVISTIVLVAVYVGVLGITLQAWLHTKVAPAIVVYRAHPEAFHLAILVIGTGVSAVTGSLAILKAYYYAEASLPTRLLELIEKAKTDHLTDRPELLAYVRGPFKTKDFLVPAIYSNPLSRLLSLVGFSTVRHRARELAASVDIRAGEIEALSSKKEDVENRKVTGHLLRAEYFEALACNCSRGSVEWRGYVQESLSEYQAILKIRSDELEALEGAAAQMYELGSDPHELMRLLRKTVRAAERQNQAQQHARALRRLAVFDDQQNLWDAARARLAAAQDVLRPRAFSNEDKAELASIMLLYGKVQTKREKFMAARQALAAAGQLFELLEDSDGGKKVKEAIGRLDEASGDPEGPGPV